MKLACAAVLALFAVPALADDMSMDVTTLTCAELMKMDMTGMMSAGMAVKMAMMDDAKMAAMTDEQAMKAAEEACKAHMDAKVLDALHM